MFSANRNLFAQIIKKQESFSPALTSLATSSGLGEIYDLFCFHAHYLRPVLLFPLCSMLHPEVESRDGLQSIPQGRLCQPGSCTLVTQMAMHTLWSQKGVKENTQHKNCQSVQISLQGRDILEHNARSLSLCSLVETVFRIH